ncbi:MAG: SDR family oxidoreductase [Rhodobacteraceae bacterium]|nr:SDR family oxidoreductase [Paracoccaceae bacterium]
MPQTYLVNGAASGIGEAVVRLLIREGHNVTAMDIDAARLDNLAAELNSDNLLISVGSVARQDDCIAAVTETVNKFCQINGLSHNAGIQRYGTAEETPPDLWDQVMDVNLKGAYLMARAAMPELRKTKGAIVFMGSVQSMAAQQGALAYVVSKHGMLGLSNALAMDHASEGIRVNTVAPGAINTAMLRHTIATNADPEGLENTLNNMHPLRRMGQPSEIAALVAFLLSDKASFITGEIIRADGGLMTLIGGSPEER